MKLVSQSELECEPSLPAGDFGKDRGNLGKSELTPKSRCNPDL